MKKYKNYSDQDILDSVRTSKSMAQVLKKLNLRQAGGNFNTVRKNISRLNIDTSHFTGQLWSKDNQLKDWKNYKKSGNLKKHLIKLRGHKCEKCSLLEWNKLPIPIEIHHIDGKRFNNELDNLQLLCPNCHAQTDNYRNKKR